MFWNTLQDHGVAERINDIVAAQPSRHADRQALPGVFIDQIQHAHGPAIVRPGADEIVRPYMIPVFGPQPHARSIFEPQPSSWFLLLWYFQPFTTPDALDPVLAHPPARSLQQRRDPAIAIAAILISQLENRSGECILVFALYRYQTLRASWLIHQPARMSLTDPMRLPGMV